MLYRAPPGANALGCHAAAYLLAAGLGRSTILWEANFATSGFVCTDEDTQVDRALNLFQLAFGPPAKCLEAVSFIARGMVLAR